MSKFNRARYALITKSLTDGLTQIEQGLTAAENTAGLFPDAILCDRREPFRSLRAAVFRQFDELYAELEKISASKK